MEIPVYLFTGFLESGKTTFISENLKDDEFIAGEKTLVIMCEEGLEEYEEVSLAGRNIDIVAVEEESQLTEEFLMGLENFYRPARILIEYNGMWKVQTISQAMPENWNLIQVITTIDTSTFDTYCKNMRSMVMDQVSMSDLVIFNRCEEDKPRASYRRSIKATNAKAMIVFEDVFGRPIEAGEEDLPYDVNADTIELRDEEFGIWYIDAMEHPKKYIGKTIKTKAIVYRNDKIPSNLFVPGRFAMTCCADDITFIGFVCTYADAHRLPVKAWVEVTAKIGYEYRKEYKQKGPVLYANEVKPATQAKDRLIYFN